MLVSSHLRRRGKGRRRDRRRRQERSCGLERLEARAAPGEWLTFIGGVGLAAMPEPGAGGGPHGGDPWPALGEERTGDRSHEILAGRHLLHEDRLGLESSEEAPIASAALQRAAGSRVVTRATSGEGQIRPLRLQPLARPPEPVVPAEPIGGGGGGGVMGLRTGEISPASWASSAGGAAKEDLSLGPLAAQGMFEATGGSQGRTPPSGPGGGGGGSASSSDVGGQLTSAGGGPDGAAPGGGTAVAGVNLVGVAGRGEGSPADARPSRPPRPPR